MSTDSISPVGQVQGSLVYDEDGATIGTIDELAIDKHDGVIRGATIHFGGVLGVGGTRRELPWQALCYSSTLDGYVVKAAWCRDSEELEQQPTFQAMPQGAA